MADQGVRRNMGTLVWTGGSEARKCPKCGVLCPQGEFCWECGAKVTTASTTPDAPVSDPQAPQSAPPQPSDVPAATPPSPLVPLPQPSEAAKPTVPAPTLDELPPAPRSPFRFEIPRWGKALPGLLRARLASLWGGSPKPAEPSLARKMAEAKGQERATTFFTPGGVVEKVKADPQGYARELALAALALLILVAFYVVISLT